MQKSHIDVPEPPVLLKARTDTRLTSVPAGRGPDGPQEASRTARADFPRPLALDVMPSHAELIVGAWSTSDWRRDASFAKACDVLSSVAAPYGCSRQIACGVVAAVAARFHFAVVEVGGAGLRAACGR
ncbi:hypothetical protein ABT121_34820 [Streptomyces sp. NPDC001928]|uniref:hypothetical protein n=1 Tax=Streptomyces sp. NPDC001928 TaxID=3154404 RepID=UPI00331D0448